MKRILRISIMLMLILALVATSVQAFTPPGQLKQMDRENSASEEDQGRYGPGRELPPGLRGKGTPPGLQKRGLDLPPGLENRKDNLPPGIQMRFVDALMNWEDLGDPEIHSIQLQGYDYLSIPTEEEIKNTYSAVAKDQYGKRMKDEEVTLELQNSDEIEGISFEIDENKGVLTLTSVAATGEIEIKAVSETKKSVTNSMKVELVSADIAIVSDEDSLVKAMKNGDVGVIVLEDDIIIEESLIINRHVTIDGSYDSKAYALKAYKDLEGWMLIVEEEADLRLYSVSLNGNKNDHEDLEGLIKVEKDASIIARNNTLENAPVGFGIWMEAYDEGEENYEEDEKQYTDENEFQNVAQAVMFYDNEDEVLYPVEDIE